MNMNYTMCSVCTGNACRSAFAECVTKKRLADAGRSDIEVFSPVTTRRVCQNANFDVPSVILTSLIKPPAN